MTPTPWWSHRGIAAAVLAAAILAFGPAVSTFADDPPVLEYMSSGSGPAAAEFNRVMPQRAVQALLLEIVSPAALDAAGVARPSVGE